MLIILVTLVLVAIVCQGRLSVRYVKRIITLPVMVVLNVQMEHIVPWELLVPLDVKFALLVPKWIILKHIRTAKETRGLRHMNGIHPQYEIRQSKFYQKMYLI